MNIPVYNLFECVNHVKRLFPFIPKFIIKRVLYGNDSYMFKKGIIDWKPSITDYNKK